ncbi:hypothetical protein FO519_007409 [Halicephalobus sp. NKZ332]|nr:hypothetical protein FO519_007409 [Halicephalobus sp. NKZ332]
MKNQTLIPELWADLFQEYIRSNIGRFNFIRNTQLFRFAVVGKEALCGMEYHIRHMEKMGISPEHVSFESPHVCFRLNPKADRRFCRKLMILSALNVKELSVGWYSAWLGPFFLKVAETHRDEIKIIAGSKSADPALLKLIPALTKRDVKVNLHADRQFLLQKLENVYIQELTLCLFYYPSFKPSDISFWVRNLHLLSSPYRYLSESDFVNPYFASVQRLHFSLMIPSDPFLITGAYKDYFPNLHEMKFSILLRRATFSKLISVAEELKKVLKDATAPVIKARIYPEKLIYNKNAGSDPESIGSECEKIGKGLCVLVGVSSEDSATDTEFIIRKILNLRLFDNPENEKRWDKSVKDLGLEVLIVSQFTLYGLLKGNKIDYHRAMEPTKAKDFYGQFYKDLQKAYIPEKVKDGEFGAMMKVNIVNDGPVTITLDSRDH